MSSARKHTADALDVPKLLPVSVAILDRSGTIVGVNEAWKDFGRRSNALVEDKFAARFELGEREYHDAETAFGRSARGEAMHAAYSEETSRAIQRYEMNL